MRWLRWVPLGVLLLGAAEFFALVGVAELVGLGPAILGLLALTVLGGLLVRREGVKAWRKLRASSGPAGDEVLHGVVGLLAALLLLVPGYITGVAGLVLLIPPVRRLASGRMRRATENRVSSSAANSMFGPRQVKVTTTKHPPRSGTTSEDVIEGEIVD